MNKKIIISATDKTMHKLKTLSKKKRAVKEGMMVMVKKLSSKAKHLVVTKKGNDLYKNKKTVISAADNTILKLKVSANKKEGVRGRLAVTAKKLATIAKEKESVRSKLVVIAKKLAITAKEKESTKNKLIVTAKQLALLAKEKESVRHKLEITAKKLAVTAKEKESVRHKLEITAKKLAVTAKEKETVRGKLAVTAETLRLKAKQLATTAKEKETVRGKLAVTAETLRLKAKQLATTAKEKETVRGKLAVTAETLRLKAKQLATTAKEKESIKDRLEITAKQLVMTAKEKETVRRNLEVTAKNLANLAKEKESIKDRLEITAKQLAATADEKEEVRSKLAVTAKQLATTAEEKEDTRSKLAVTAKQLAKTAEEKEYVRGKLAVTAKQLAATADEKEEVRSKLAIIAETLRLKAKQLATTAKEKESIKGKLEITAKKLAVTAKEKETVRGKLAITAETLRLKAKQLATTAKEKEVFITELKKFKLAVDNISDQVIITDPDANVLYINKATEKITGYTAEEVLGKKSGKLWGKLMEESFYENLWKTIKIDKKTFIGEIVNKRKDNEKYTASLSISPILDKNNKIKFFVAIENDITKEKEIDKSKTEFVSLASHQLRTPLTSISWYTEMILNGDVGAVNDKQKKYLEEIYQGNKRMIDLVDVLLNVSRIEMGTFVSELEETDIVEIAKSVCNEQKFQIENKNLTLTENFSKDIPIFHTDKKFTRMIFQNLLSNSVKYTPQDGKIEFTISLDKQNILIKISDTGYGIPKNHQEKIFTKLFRADNILDKDTSGTGLGLYIVKSTVEKLGGKIWFESEENKGTTFYVTFPLDSRDILSK